MNRYFKLVFIKDVVSGMLILCLLSITSCTEKAGESVKIITYNVWQGYIDGEHTRLPVHKNGQLRKEGIYQWLKQQEPDVVVFQELMNYSREQLKHESSQWNHKFAIIHKEKGMGIGISSKYPIVEIETLIEGMHHGLIYCETAGIDIIATHLWPRFDEKILDEINQVIARVDQSKMKGRPVIVLGDFNALSPEDDRYLSEATLDLYANYWNWKLENNRPNYRVIQAMLDAGLKDVFIPFREEKMQEDYRVDFIFASPSLADKCTNAEFHRGVQLMKLSDHFPVSAEFNMANIKIRRY